MRGHYLLKWLFLTVLSVSVLHFRETSPAGRYRFEQTSNNGHFSRKNVFSFKHFKPSANPSELFAHFKNAQSARFSCLSLMLSEAADIHPALRLYPAIKYIYIQNQHFRSRTLSCDDNSIFQS
ncbi:hypothetical protein [Dyadobacter sp. SG02]|uniref:hypothetical protein n=1 Tax=Dyadobacter sp. SG02 TaxID=1855291 RepID=UPI000B8724A0|nr:hypothetical protein [Dyadobacter sp. SG02]